MRAVTGVRSLLFPDSIAVIGASPRNVAAVETVVASGVRAWGVNPGREEVAGLRCYPTVADSPEVPELALLMVNHERVEAAFDEAAAADVRAFVVPGVGAEAGPDAKETTEWLAARARELDAALLGPNCMGFFVPGGPAAWNGRPQDTTASGHVAVLCQSGLVTAKILLVNETRDAATPYAGALAVRRLFPSASLVAGIGGTTHSSSLSGVPCVDNAVSAYLRSGMVPRRLPGNRSDRRCSRLVPPSPSTWGRSSTGTQDRLSPLLRQALIRAQRHR